MSLLSKVAECIEQAEGGQLENDEELLRAERLADQYKDIKPVPFDIPIERFCGLPAYSERT